MPTQTDRYARSRALYNEAKTIIPGGVNSPVRAFRSVGGDPLFMDRAAGSYLWDTDGNRYIDYIGSWGPMILGHNHPSVVAAIQEQLLKGTSFGAPTELEVEMARLVTTLIPSIEMVRMVNSGTEATMSALRLARAFTGRHKIIKFSGNYHGHADMLLAAAGSGVATLGLPDSPGVPPQVAADTLTAPYNDLSAVQTLFEAYPSEIAAIIVEPIAGNMGCIPPQPAFLAGLRQLTEQFGALLIFDEVMTGFRVHPHSAQGLYEVTPDLTCLGKIIGGGLPVGAYGGRLDIMSHVAPAGSMYQAGTLSGNPLAMAAGLATLRELQKPGFYEQLEHQSARLGNGLRAIAQSLGLPTYHTRVGSMMTVFFQSGPVFDYDSAKRSDTERFKQFFRGMLDRGIYLAPSQFEAAFVSAAHSDQDIDTTLEAAEAVMKQL